MKTLFRFLFVFSSLLVISCDDVEPTIYNGDINNDDTFLTFSATLYTLPVIIDETGSVTIRLNASTVSTVDRVYNLEIIEEESTANPATYTFPSTITIPANSYQGTIVVEGVDNNLVETTPKPFVFRITNIGEKEYIDTEKITVNVVEVCPLSDDFVGEYRYNQLTGSIGLNDGEHPIFGENSIIELEVGDSEFERTFTDVPYPSLSSFPEVTASFNLSCGETVLSNDIEMPFFCTADVDFIVRRGNISAIFNPEDDSVIEVTVTEDAIGTCGGPYQRTFRLTKVN